LEKRANVEILRTSDWQLFSVKTHLGDVIRCNSQVDGFDLTTLNYTEDLESMKNSPQVILVRKSIDRMLKKERIFKLKNLEKDGVIVDEEKEGKKKSKKEKKNNKDEEDYQEFLDEVETNPAMRAQMNLYKNE